MFNKERTQKKNKRPALSGNKFLKTGLLFCLLAILGNVLAYFLTKGGYTVYFETLTTKASAYFIQLTGLKAVVNKNIIHLSNSVWLVDTECTAINLIVIFVSFILVYPASFRAKAIGLLAGLPFIFVANISRLLAMAWVDQINPAYSVYFHDYIWQVVFLILVAFKWLLWIDKVVNRAIAVPLSV